MQTFIRVRVPAVSGLRAAVVLDPAVRVADIGVEAAVDIAATADRLVVHTAAEDLRANVPVVDRIEAMALQADRPEPTAVVPVRMAAVRVWALQREPKRTSGKKTNDQVSR